MERNLLKPVKRFIFGRNYLFNLIFLLLVLALDLSAGVLVAPTSVILSERKRTGRLTVQNPTDRPKEVTIAFSFGIPVSDSLGHIRIRLQDSAVTDERSAMDWVKAFPRKMILAPNASQVIRFLARPPKDLADGEYWARVVVRSSEGETTIPPPTDDQTISTKLNMIMQTAIILKYRTGNLVSKLEVEQTLVNETDSLVTALIDLKSRGNVSYVGVLDCRLIDATGKEVSSSRIDLAVYRTLRRKVNLWIQPGEFKRPYRIKVSISTDGRKDIPAEDMIAGNSIVYTTLVE